MIEPKLLKQIDESNGDLHYHIWIPRIWLIQKKFAKIKTLIWIIKLMYFTKKQ